MRVLIATVTAGGGHLQAASALEEAWRRQCPADQVEKVDLLDFVPKLQRQAYAEGFLLLVAHAPELWSLVFKKTDHPALLRKLTRFRRGLARHTNRAFFRHLQDFQPEVVLCTHFLPLEIMGSLRSQEPEKPPFTVCIVTDFEAHALWIEPAVDLYCVAMPETRASLSARGVDPGKIVATGIPIAAKFACPIEVKTVRRRYGWRDDLPLVLVLGGGFGMGPVGDILKQLDALQREFQIVVVAGRNAELRSQLATVDRRHPVDILGFATNMQELMAAADLIVSKPGGLTTSETLSLGKPLFILNPIPGQEAANSDFLLEHGAAAKVNRVEDVPFRVEQLLNSTKLKEMSRAAKTLGRPQAAEDICREVLRRIHSR